MTTIMEALTTVMGAGMLPGGGIGTITRMAAMNREGITVRRIAPAEVGAGGVASLQLLNLDFFGMLPLKLR